MDINKFVCKCFFHWFYFIFFVFFYQCPRPCKIFGTQVNNIIIPHSTTNVCRFNIVLLWYIIRGIACWELAFINYKIISFSIIQKFRVVILNWNLAISVCTFVNESHLCTLTYCITYPHLH